jgi:hypothetical protein
MGTAHVPQAVAAAQFRLLRREAVAVDRRLGGAAGCADEGKAGQARPLFEQVLRREIR